VAAAARGDRRHQAAWPVVKAPPQKNLRPYKWRRPPSLPPGKTKKERGEEGAGAPRAAAVAQLVAEGVGAMADGHKLLKRELVAEVLKRRCDG
jgi:hypothetical protein